MAQITQDEIATLGTILSVWAHPDDESYSCAGIMCVARANGQQVVCITATRGEVGVQDESRWPAAQLGEIRAQEMAEALQIIGVSEHHWLGYRDGCCQDIPNADAVEQLKTLINYYNPNSILTFGPEGMTGHPDHCCVSNWVSAATRGTDTQVYHAVQIRSRYELLKTADEQFDIFFNIDAPPLVDEEQADILFELTKDCLSQKLSALRAMPSQTEAMFTTLGEGMVNDMIQVESFVRASHDIG